MIEDCYIHQLKSIREKYFPQQLVKTQQLGIDAHSTSCNNTNRNTSDKHQYH